MSYARFDNLELTAFYLKLLASKSHKTILVSAGEVDSKQRLLPLFQRLAALNITVYATEGTSAFFGGHKVANKLIHKIAEEREPNIRSFLEDDRLDLVINILTGNQDYDEGSDSRLIRGFAIENGIPLITDVDVAIATLDRMLEDDAKPARAALPAPDPWDLKSHFLQMVAEGGGFSSYHAHFDKAYLISPENLKLGQVDMQKKWALYKYLKENYTHEDLVTRISRCVDAMVRSGVTHCHTMVDADDTSKLLPIKAALEVKERYKDSITLEIGVQPLQGVLDPETRKYFVQACELADTIGGLPSKDRPLPEKHMDFILELGKDLGKRVDVHVDQENNPYESETEQLALKTIEHGMEGRVCAVHSISVSAKPLSEQDRILKVVKDAGLGVIVCPSAALSMRQLDMKAPLHNSIAPVVKMLEAEIPIFMGIDNIADLFMPVVDGDMWFECRALMESTRYYDIEKVAEIASDSSWFGQRNNR